MGIAVVSVCGVVCGVLLLGVLLGVLLAKLLQQRLSSIPIDFTKKSSVESGTVNVTQPGTAHQSMDESVNTSSADTSAATDTSTLTDTSLVSNTSVVTTGQ